MHDPPRTHEKITGKTDSFRASFVFTMTQLHIPFFRFARKEEKMDKIHNMKMTLGERIREQRILMQMTQEELAEELCVKKSTISMYENDKVDIKGSILIELSGGLHTSPNYLLGMEEYEEDLLEIITVYKNLKGSKTKQIALEQMKLLATMSSEL